MGGAREHIWVAGAESGLAECKTSALSTVLSLWPCNNLLNEDRSAVQPVFTCECLGFHLKHQKYTHAKENWIKSSVCGLSQRVNTIESLPSATKEDDSSEIMVLCFEIKVLGRKKNLTKVTLVYNIANPPVIHWGVFLVMGTQGEMLLTELRCVLVLRPIQRKDPRLPRLPSLSLSSEASKSLLALGKPALAISSTTLFPTPSCQVIVLKSVVLSS